MKAYTIVILLAVFLSGCSFFSKSPTANVYKKLDNETTRLEMVGALSVGVDTSLKKSDIPAAEKLNNHIAAIAETPTPAEVKLVLGSLENREKEERLEKKLSELIAEKRKIETNQLRLVDSLTAANAKLKQEMIDTADELNKMQSPFYAIYYGIKTLIMRSLYVLLGGTIVFFVLRAFAATNPIVGAIFSVLERMVAFVIKAIAGLFPKSTSFASLSPATHTHTLRVLIDTIETLRIKNPLFIEQLTDAISRNADNADKTVIQEIRKQLGY